VALASLSLGITPASAARVSEGTSSSIGVIEASSDAQQFNLGNLEVQGSSTGLVARRGERNDGGVRKVIVVPAFLVPILEFFGIQTTQDAVSKDYLWAS